MEILVILERFRDFQGPIDLLKPFLTAIPERPIDVFLPHIEPSRLKKVADKVLEEFDDVAKSLNIKHFLVLGTCLGMVRDKGYIEGDHDIDLGLLCNEDELKTLYNKLIQRGFIHGSNGTIGNFHLYKDNIMLDVYPPPHGIRDQPFFKTFNTISYNGRTYNVPHPVEDYLEYHYGNWRVRC